MMSPATSFFVLNAGAEGPLVLHPFGEGSNLYAEAERSPSAPRLEGRFAPSRAPGSFAELRAGLDAELEAGLRRHLLDKGFALRVFASAGVFLVVFLFMSIVIRDPIPLVDEVVGGALGALALRAYLARRALSAPSALALAESLRRSLGEAYFVESSAVAVAEAWLEEAFGGAAFLSGGSLSSPAAFEAWLDREAPMLGADEVSELGVLVELVGKELERPGLSGSEAPADIEARARRLLLRLDPRRPPRGKALRDAELSLLYVKARSVLRRGAAR